MENPENAVAIRPEAEAMEFSAAHVKAQVGNIQAVMKAVMKPGEHFGTIPGVKHPSLYKAGAEKLCLTFRLAPEYKIDRGDLAEGHREYQVICALRHIVTGALMGEGVGMCSSQESKYRYRGGGTTDTGEAVPKAYWDSGKDFGSRNADLIGGKGFKAVKDKDTGAWTIHEKTGDRVENPDIADVFNTVLKMAKKRAHVDAVLTATAASDIFTQDVEDMAREPERTGGGPGKDVEGQPPLHPPPASTPTARETAPQKVDQKLVDAFMPELEAVAGEGADAVVKRWAARRSDWLRQCVNDATRKALTVAANGLISKLEKEAQQ